MKRYEFASLLGRCWVHPRYSDAATGLQMALASILVDMVTERGKVTLVIYFIQAESGDLIKIGYTGGCPKQRLASLQVGSPVKLRLLGTMPGDMRLERTLHAKFARYWSHGEWFRLTDEILSFMARPVPVELLPRLKRYKVT